MRQAGEGHAGDARILDQPRADRRPAGQHNERVLGHAGLVQQRHRLGGDQRGLRRRLRQHRIAGHQRGGDLPGEDGEREVPGADRDEHAAAVQGEPVALSGRARQIARCGPDLRLNRIVAQEIHRLAHLGDCIWEGLAALAHAPGEQFGCTRLVQVGRAPEALGAILQRGALPGGKAGLGPTHGVGDRLGIGLDHAADPERSIGGIEHRSQLAPRVADARPCLEARLERALQVARQIVQHRRITQIDAAGVASIGAIQVPRQWDSGMALGLEARQL